MTRNDNWQCAVEGCTASNYWWRQHCYKCSAAYSADAKKDQLKRSASQRRRAASAKRKEEEKKKKAVQELPPVEDQHKETDKKLADTIAQKRKFVALLEGTNGNEAAAALLQQEIKDLERQRAALRSPAQRLQAAKAQRDAKQKEVDETVTKAKELALKLKTQRRELREMEDEIVALELAANDAKAADISDSAIDRQLREMLTAQGHTNVIEILEKMGKLTVSSKPSATMDTDVEMEKPTAGTQAQMPAGHDVPAVDVAAAQAQAVAAQRAATAEKAIADAEMAQAIAAQAEDAARQVQAAQAATPNAAVQARQGGVAVAPFRAAVRHRQEAQHPYRKQQRAEDGGVIDITDCDADFEAIMEEMAEEAAREEALKPFQVPAGAADEV
eukprot:TRINITY_DN1023_c0_g1_i2.p4 TRINITY_DN1023_c0_g1~~TRINITY_DN1023_c0_g1_i2.p4  ORF type:complete len:387 (-),score=145.43 TRINITY_DN1023_c0_g1_i2:5377-6537(-)